MPGKEERKVKVLILSHMYPVTYNTVYGIFVHKQVKALVNAGVEVRVVSPVPWAPWPLDTISKKWRGYSEVPYRDEIDGIPVYYPRYLAYPRAWFFSSSGKRMYRWIKGTVGKIYKEFPFDLIHAHVALPDGYAASMLAEEHGCPFVVTIHGQDFFITALKATSSRNAIAQVFKKSGAIMVVSRKLKDIGCSFFPKEKDNFLVVPNGVDPEIYEQLSGLESQVEHKPNDGPHIVSVSYLIKRKGLDVNIRAIEKLRNKYPGIQYTVVGDGDQRDPLAKLSKDLGMEDHVQFVGRVDHKTALSYMSGSDVFSLPSWNEAFGVVYIEAMACGKPVVGCRGEGIEDFVEHGVNGMLVEPQNVDDLAEKLDHLLSHPEEAREMGEKARELVLETFTWNSNAKKMISTYQQCLIS